MVSTVGAAPPGRARLSRSIISAGGRTEERKEARGGRRGVEGGGGGGRREVEERFVVRFAGRNRLEDWVNDGMAQRIR